MRRMRPRAVGGERHVELRGRAEDARGEFAEDELRDHRLAERQALLILQWARAKFGQRHRRKRVQLSLELLGCAMLLIVWFVRFWLWLRWTNSSEPPLLFPLLDAHILDGLKEPGRWRGVVWRTVALEVTEFINCVWPRPADDTRCFVDVARVYLVFMGYVLPGGGQRCGHRAVMIKVGIGAPPLYNRLTSPFVALVRGSQFIHSRSSDAE